MLLLILWILPSFYSRRVSGPKKVLWAINRINTKVSPWPFQQCGMAGIFMCLPQALPKFLSIPVSQKPFPVSSFLAAVRLGVQAEKHSSQQSRDPPTLLSGHGINPSLPAGPVPGTACTRAIWEPCSFSSRPSFPGRAASPHWPEDESSLDCFQLAPLNE